MLTFRIASLAFFSLLLALPLRAFDWETATSNGREYVSLHSFCVFYGFNYQVPSGNDRFVSRSASGHSISFKIGNSDAYLDGVHYVLSFPIEGGDRDWLVSRMDVIKLFEPVLRPTEVSGRHAIRGVVIDAGHGGSDNGATSRLGNEKTYTLDTAYRLDALLRAAGLKTVFTPPHRCLCRSLRARPNIASLYPDYCFVSIHFNSATEEARGLETYCLSPRGAASTSSAYLTRGDIQKLPGNDYDTQNIVLASMVHSEIIKLNPGDATADRGVKRGAVRRHQTKRPARHPRRRRLRLQSHGGGPRQPFRISPESGPGHRPGRDPLRQRHGGPACAIAGGESRARLREQLPSRCRRFPPAWPTIPRTAPSRPPHPWPATLPNPAATTALHKKKLKSKKTVATPELSQPPVLGPAAPSHLVFEPHGEDRSEQQVGRVEFGRSAEFARAGHPRHHRRRRKSSRRAGRAPDGEHLFHNQFRAVVPFESLA